MEDKVHMYGGGWTYKENALHYVSLKIYLQRMFSVYETAKQLDGGWDIKIIIFL